MKASTVSTRKRRVFAPIAVSLAAVLLAGFGSTGSTNASNGSANTSANASASPRRGGTLTVSSTTEVTTLDPSKGAANAMALTGYAIYDTLMTVPKLGDKPQPNIATSLTQSRDRMTWTMKLPIGIKFSDGTSFDAWAVKFNLDRNRRKGSTAASLLSSIASVKVPNRRTVIIHMKYPFPNLPYVFSYDGSGTAGYVASPTALKKYGDNYTAHAAGVGPYKLESWAPGQPEVLVRNPNYWNKKKYNPFLDRVVIKTISDQQTAYQALQAGDIDLMSTVIPALMKDAQNNQKVRFVQGVGGDQDSIILNMATAPFDDLRVRQAVSMALDRRAIVQLASQGIGKPAVSLFAPGSPYDTGNSDPTFNPAGAQRLIQQYQTSTGKKAEFAYSCNNTRPANDVIVAQLRQAGFTVNTDIRQYPEWVSVFFAKKYQAICWTMAAFLTPDLLPYRFFYSTGDLNTNGFGSQRFDEYADTARVAPNAALHKKNWAAADKVLTTQLPWVWTTSAPIGFILSKRVKGIEYDQPSRLRYSVPSFYSVWLAG